MSSRNPRFPACLCAIAAGLVPGLPALGEPVAGGDTFVPCEASGWADKPETAIRAGPWEQAPVIDTVSPRAETGAETEFAGVFPEFEIRGSWNGWFLITGTSYGDYDDPPPDAEPYSGYGWVRGEDISGQLLPGGFRDTPSEEAPARGYGTDTDAVAVRRVIACTGWWVKVKTDVGSGWVSGLCGNQVTTCS